MSGAACELTGAESQRIICYSSPLRSCTVALHSCTTACSAHPCAVALLHGSLHSCTSHCVMCITLALFLTLALSHPLLHCCTAPSILALSSPLQCNTLDPPTLSTALIALSLTPTLHWNRKTFWVTCSEHFLQCYALLCNRMHCNVKSTLCHLLGNPQR